MIVRSNTVIHLTALSVLLVVAVAGVRAQAPTTPAPMADAEELLMQALDRLEMGDLQSANALCSRAAAIQPKLTKLKLVQGLIFAAERRGVDAVSRLEQYNSSHEGQSDYRGFATIGEVFIESRMFRQAIYPLETAARLAPLEDDKKEPVKAQITMNLATAQVRLNKADDAITTAQKAAQLAPTNGSIHMILGQVAAVVKRIDISSKATNRAITLFRNELRDDAFSMQIHSNLKQCYDVLASLRQQAVKTEPDNGELFLELAKVLEERSRIDRRLGLINARQFAVHALDIMPQDLDLKVYVASLEFALGGVESARERIDQVLIAAPQNAAALELRETMNEASSIPPALR